MNRLTEQKGLAQAVRFETQHFLAFSNAEDEFTERRLNDCELIYELFFDHFRKKGFYLRDPDCKLMVAIFESQAGFEAYLGQRLPSGLLGVYVPESNRLVVYDIGQSREYAARKQQNRDAAKNIGSVMDRQRALGTANRQLSELRSQYNIGAIMHETAHHLSFNCGLFNRHGLCRWAGEGLATYCEATVNGSWQGFGEPNPERLRTLAAIQKHQAPLISLTELITSDRGLLDPQIALSGYAESWALFSMLMEERPTELRSYLTRIYNNREEANRLEDFTAVFGNGRETSRDASHGIHQGASGTTAATPCLCQVISFFSYSSLWDPVHGYPLVGLKGLRRFSRKFLGLLQGSITAP